MTPERYRGNRLSGPALWAARALWVALAAPALGLWGMSSLRFLREPVRPAAEVTDPTVFTTEDLQVLQGLGLPEALATAPVAFFLLLDVVYFALGAWIFWRRSDQGVALLSSFALVILGATILGYTFETVNRAYPQWGPLMNALSLLAIVSVALLLYIFPDGRFVPRWTRALPIVFGAMLFSFFLLPLREAVRQGAIIVAMLGILGTGAYARIYRYRYASTSMQRQQTKWIALGLTVLAGGIALWSVALVAIPPDRPSPARVYFLMTGLSIGAVVGVLFPVSVAVSVLRHRLWDIDILINRTVVYGPLTGILMGLYIGSIRLFQGLFVRFTGEQSSFAILLSTLVLAGAFMPLRLRLQTLADRYFKETPDPGKGLKVFREQMRSLAQLADVAHVTRQLLDETVAAFHARSGAVSLQEGDTLRIAQTAGAWSGAAEVSVPLEHAGVRMGELSLGTRHKGEEYTSRDREALRAIAEAAAQALALSLALQAGGLAH